MSIRRRAFGLRLAGICCTAAMAASTLLVGNAAAADPLVVAIRGGVLGDFHINILGPLFEEEFGIPVVFTVDTSGPALAKVQAEAANPQTDVLWTVSSTQLAGQQAGLFEQMDLSNIPNASSLDPQLVDPNGYFVALGVDIIGVIYHTDVFERRGFPAPTSWEDLFRPEYRGRVVISEPTNSFGQAAIAGLTSIASGGLQTDEAAQPVLDRLVAAGQDILWSSSPSHMVQLLTQEDAWIGSISDTRGWELVGQGAPVEYVIPEEGGFYSPLYWAIVKDAPNMDGAYKWINWYISPRIQAMRTEAFSSRPVNPDALALVQDEEIKARFDRPLTIAPIDWTWIEESTRDWVRALQIGG